jgi:hypothetical protein
MFNFSRKYRSSISFEKAAEASRQHFGHGCLLGLAQWWVTEAASARAGLRSSPNSRNFIEGCE